MKTPKVTIVDYGMCNLLNVARAFEFCEADVSISAEPEIIVKAERLVLPGVGAFADGMNELKKRNLVEAVFEFKKTQKPLLGICLGMQMLFDEGHEFGIHKGLGLVPGIVSPIEATDIELKKHKIPHIGWNSLIKPRDGGAPWENSILATTAVGSSAYFVHSYVAKPTRKENILANVDYNGRILTAAIQSENISGCQFHPEKSGEIGLEIVRQFLKL
jgi:glutamine amidotransferase